MGNTNIAILCISGVLIIWELTAVSFTNKKVNVTGAVPGQKLGIGIFAAACLVIMWAKWGIDKWQILSMAAIIVAALLNFVIRNGLSEYGIYINGWSTPYKDIRYFDFERKEGELNRIRVAALRRDITLLFTDEQMQLAFAYFSKNNVPDMQTYQVLKKKQKDDMKNRRGKR